MTARTACAGEILAACTGGQRTADPCECDQDGVIHYNRTVLSGSRGVGLEVTNTGRPGCAPHTSTWNNHRELDPRMHPCPLPLASPLRAAWHGRPGGDICYVQPDCPAARGAQPAHDSPNIKWRSCNRRQQQCSPPCEAALNNLLLRPGVGGCVSYSAERQGLCPDLELLTKQAGARAPLPPLQTAAGADSNLRRLGGSGNVLLCSETGS